MKTSNFILAVVMNLFLAGCNSKSIEIGHSVNAIIGDISYMEAFGQNPGQEADETSRIKTHLEYVENALKAKDVSGLSEQQKQNRSKMIDLLSEYRNAGEFPKNYDYPEQRIPCFIDKDGSICAVGYLIEQTAGREIAEKINSKYQYEYLLAMKDQTVDDWIANSGLTKEECAMIQPTYGPGPGYISKEYGISSSIFSGLNLSLNTINSIQISKGTNDKALGTIGLITGLGQLTLGALNYPEEYKTWQGFQSTNSAQRNLSLINIGLGTSSVILSTWNLVKNRKRKDKSYSWNVYGFPTQGNDAGLGFSFSGQF